MIRSILDIAFIIAVLMFAGILLYEGISAVMYG